MEKRYFTDFQIVRYVQRNRHIIVWGCCSGEAYGYLGRGKPYLCSTYENTINSGFRVLHSPLKTLAEPSRIRRRLAQHIS